MRDGLGKFKGTRRLYTATVSCFGESWHWWKQYRTAICLQDVMDEKLDVVADHVWTFVPEEFDLSGIKQYDQISFTAVVTRYCRGYRGSGQSTSGYGSDYTLSELGEIKVIGLDKGLMDDE